MTTGPIATQRLHNQVVGANRAAIQRNLAASVEEAKQEIFHRWAAVEAIRREGAKLFGASAGYLAIDAWAREAFGREVDEIIAGVSWQPTP